MPQPYANVKISGMNTNELKAARTQDRTALIKRVLPLAPLGIAGIILIALRYQQASGGLFATAVIIVAVIISILLFRLFSSERRALTLLPGDRWRGRVISPDNYLGVMAVRDDGISFTPAGFGKTSTAASDVISAQSLREVKVGSHKWGGALGRQATEIQLIQNAILDSTSNWLFADPAGFCAALRS